MSINFGVGGGFNQQMMGGMQQMGLNQNSGSGNVFQSFKAKYGCEDCFKKQPYPMEFVKPVRPLPYEVSHPGFWEKFRKALFGY